MVSPGLNNYCWYGHRRLPQQDHRATAGRLRAFIPEDSNQQLTEERGAAAELVGASAGHESVRGGTLGLDGAALVQAPLGLVHRY